MSNIDCIVCSKSMPNLISAPDIQPSGGLAFTSYGHYGSTIFDPMDGHYIEIAVCDECLSKATRGVSLFPALAELDGMESEGR